MARNPFAAVPDLLRLQAKASQVEWISKSRRVGAVELNGMSSIEIPHYKDLCPPQMPLTTWIQPH